MAKDAQRTGLTVKTLFSAGGLVLIFFLVILVNVVISRANLRFDLTGEKLYSLSDGSRKIMDQMERDVVIKLFYSQGQVNLPVYMKTWADRVLDFLEEYEHSSKGKITVEVYDPKPDSEEEEWAVKYGIRGFNLPTGEKIFLGLVALSADQEQTIPFLDPTREIHLEYDITRIISRVQTNKKPRIGLMSGLNAMGGAGMNPMMQQQAQPWFFTQELGKDYDLVPVAPNATEIPENLDLLVLHHPKNVPDAFLYAVDQYVLAGGRLVVMADAYSVMDQDRSPMKSSIPQKLFKAWGVEIAPDKVVADFGFSTRLRNQDNQIEDNPLWISVPSEAFNSDQIVSAELNGMLFPLPGGMRKAKDSPYDYVSMVSSSTNAGLVDAFKVTMGVDAVRKDFKPEKETMDYMVSVSGKFKTAFPDGPPEAAENKNGETKPGEKEKPATPQLKEAASENVIMIFSDADFLYDAYYLSRQNLLGFPDLPDVQRQFEHAVEHVRDAHRQQGPHQHPVQGPVRAALHKGPGPGTKGPGQVAGPGAGAGEKGGRDQPGPAGAGTGQGHR